MPQTAQTRVFPPGFLKLAAVTPSDTVPLADFPTQALYVGGAGDVSVVVPPNAQVVNYPAVPAGATLPVRATHVRATGTTATNIIRMG